jgi:predicted transcriptional regulator
MTKLLEDAIEAVRRLSPERQDEIARAILALADADVYVLTPEERAAIEASDEEVARGEFATDEEVRAIWAKHGL